MKLGRAWRRGIPHGLFTCGLATALWPASAAAYGVFDVVLTSMDAVEDRYRSVFHEAEDFWESVIEGYRTPGLAALGTSLEINVAVAPNDGVGGILGSAGPVTGFSDGNFVLPDTGVMSFDAADVESLLLDGTLGAVIVHEMAHVMGFGTLWGHNGLYVAGSGEYTGAVALSVYRQEFDPTATFIPVELDGGPGTANGHWDEDGFAPDASGHLDLFTGYLHTPVRLSATSIYSFADLGYLPRITVQAVSAVPLPSAASLLGLATLLAAVVGLRRPPERGGVSA